MRSRPSAVRWAAGRCGLDQRRLCEAKSLAYVKLKPSGRAWRHRSHYASFCVCLLLQPATKQSPAGQFLNPATVAGGSHRHLGLHDVRASRCAAVPKLNVQDDVRSLVAVGPGDPFIECAQPCFGRPVAIPQSTLQPKAVAIIVQTRKREQVSGLTPYGP
jgi:hypothetical protein